MTRAQTNSETFTISVIRAAMYGENSLTSREQAVISLAKSAYPNSVREIESFIADTRQPPDSRALAASWLGRIVHPLTAPALLRQLAVPESNVRRHIIRSLGMVGEAAAVDPLLALSECQSGNERNRTLFAAGLIQHRLRQTSSAIPLPKQTKFIPVPEATVTDIVFNYLSRRDVEACLMDIAVDPCGMVLNEDSALDIRIGADRWMLLLNAILADTDAAVDLQYHTSVFGILAEWDQVGETYYLAGLILSSPAGTAGPPRLHLHDLDGALLALGKAPSTTTANKFNLKAVSDYAGIAFDFEGELQQGRPVSTKGQAALITTRKRLATSLIASTLANATSQ